MSARRASSRTPLAPSLHTSSRSPVCRSASEQVGLGLVDAVEGLEDEVAVRVHPRLGLADPALVDEALHEGVVVGELADLAVAVEVGAAVADVAHPDALPVEVAATVAVVLVPLRAGSSSTSSPIRSCARCRAPATRPSRSSGLSSPRRVLVEAAQLLHGGAAGDVAARGAADAVADGEQPRTGVPGVLVVLADPPDVGDRGVVEPEEAAHLRSSRIVLPMRTWVPIVIVVGWVMRTVPM